MKFRELKPLISSHCIVVFEGRKTDIETCLSKRFDNYDVTEVRADYINVDEPCVVVFLAERAYICPDTFITLSAGVMSSPTSDIRAVDNNTN